MQTQRIFLLLALSGLALACRADAPARVDTLPFPDSTTAQWVASSIAGRPIVPGSRVTMGTSPEGLGGYGGCNWFGITRENGRTLVTGTARGCGMEINEQERAFTLHLGRARFAVRTGDTLRLLDSTRTETLVLTRRRPTGADGAQLVGTSWTLLSSTNPNVPKDSVTIAFTRDSVSGFGGCRRFSGTYVTRGERLSLTSLGMLTTDCIRPYADVAESHLTGALSETEHFAFRGDTLVLTTFGGDTVRFLRTR